MNHGWGQEAQSGVPVLMVVPGKERGGPIPGIGQRAKTVRVVGSVFEGLELSLGKRVVVGGVRPGVRLGYTEVKEKQGQGFGDHRTTAVRVDGESVVLDVLLLATGGDKFFG